MSSKDTSERETIQESSSSGLLLRNQRSNPEEIGKINKRDSDRKISDKCPSKHLKQEKSRSESRDDRETERCWNAAQRKYNSTVMFRMLLITRIRLFDTVRPFWATMLLESESQRLRDKKLRTKTATEGNLLLILLVHKLRTNTGFYTETNPRKTRAKCLKT